MHYIKNIFIFILCFIYSWQSYAQEALKDFTLTSDEQLWVSENPVVRISNQMEWAPIDFVQGGKPAGFSIDYVNLVLQRVGLTAEYINGYSWEELHNQAEDKKIDIIHSLIQTDERDKHFLFTNSYLDLSLGYFAKKDSQRIRTPSDLANKRIGIIKGSGTESAYRQEYPNLNLVGFSDITEAIIALSSGNIDLYVGRIPVVNYAINKNFMADLELVGDVFLSEQTNTNSVKIAIRNDRLVLRNIVDKGMLAISNEEYNNLINKWQARSGNDPILSLTDEEKA